MRIGLFIGAMAHILGGGAPTISSLDIDLGDPAGGDVRMLTGTGFTGTTAVTVDATSATFVVLSDSELLFVTPAHAAGPVNVTVTTPSGTSAPVTFEYWSPASLALTSYWDRGNYQDTTAGTWPGLASAGSSGGRDLTQGTASAQPTEVNLEPDFDGTNDYLQHANGAFFGTSGSVCAIVCVDSVAAQTNPYVEETIYSSSDVTVVMSISDGGVAAEIHDGAYKVVRRAATVGELHLAIMRWNGVALGLAVDGGTEATTPAGNCTYGSCTGYLGMNYTSAAFLDGRIRMLLTMASTISDANAAKLLKWARASRGLA